MPIFQQLVTRPTKRLKVLFEEIQQASEIDSDTAGILKLSDWELKTTLADSDAKVSNGKSKQHTGTDG